MVKVTNYAIRERKDGTSFVSIELSGSVELIQSQSSGNFYATIRKCNVPATFSEDVAKMMIGQELEGDVVRVQVNPYAFTNPRTGEVMTLVHSYAYRPKGALEVIGETRVQETSLAPF